MVDETSGDESSQSSYGDEAGPEDDSAVAPTSEPMVLEQPAEVDEEDGPQNVTALIVESDD